MKSLKWILPIAIVALAGVIFWKCSANEPKSTRWEDASTTPAPSSSLPAVATGSFNKFFPKDDAGGYKRVFTADKEGYAEAKLQKDGKDVATLSISDAKAVPGAAAKFEGASEKLAVGGDEYPLVKVGNNQSSVLVKGRYQVKVSSPTLDHDARKTILSTFDLKGLGAL